MRNVKLLGCLLMGTLALIPGAAIAQQTVHGLAGVVTSINPGTQTMHINPDDGSEGLFAVMTDKKTNLSFPKDVAAISTPATEYNKLHSHVLVFYFGGEDERTIVALEDLGPGPFARTLGTFVKLDKHAHELIIQTDTGEKVFNIDPKTVGEASDGVVLGEKFSVDKGAHLSVISTSENGTPTAVFIRALTL